MEYRYYHPPFAVIYLHLTDVLSQGIARAPKDTATSEPTVSESAISMEIDETETTPTKRRKGKYAGSCIGTDS